MKRLLLLFVAAVLWLAPQGVRAQELHPASLLDDSSAPGEEGRFWAGLQVEILAQRDASHKLIFGKDVESYGVEGGWHLERGVDLIFSLAYRQDNGKRRAVGNLLQTLTNKEKLHLLPMEGSLRYRLIFMKDQWFVPYVKGGVSSIYFNTDTTNDFYAKNVWGFKWGLHGGGGVLWRIEGLDPNSRHSLRSDGILGLFLDTGFHYQWVNNFNGKGFDFSAAGARLGLTLLIE